MICIWDATHLLHDVSLDCSVSEVVLQCQRIMTWDKCGGSCFTHYTIHVAPNYTNHTLCGTGKTVHINTCSRPSRCLPFKPLFPCDLAHMHCGVIRGVGVQVMRVVNYAHFSLNKFESLPLITFDHVFHTSLSKPNPCTNFFDSQPQICPPKTTIESIYQSIASSSSPLPFHTYIHIHMCLYTYLPHHPSLVLVVCAPTHGLWFVLYFAIGVHARLFCRAHAHAHSLWFGLVLRNRCSCSCLCSSYVPHIHARGVKFAHYSCMDSCLCYFLVFSCLSLHSCYPPGPFNSRLCSLFFP